MRIEKIVIISVSFIISLVFCELLAISYYKPNDVNYFLAKNSDFFTRAYYKQPSTEYFSKLYTFDKIEKESDNVYLGRELIPNSEGYIGGAFVKINSDGIRDKEYSLNKPKDTYRIAVIGDSFTFGDGVLLNETFVKLLEKRLNQNPDLKYEVINFGVYGYGIKEIKEFYEYKVKKYNPDLVLYAYFPNDPESGYSEKCYLNDEEKSWFVNREKSMLFYFLKLHSTNLFNSIRYGKYTAYHMGLHSDDFIGWYCTKKILRTGFSEKNTAIFIIPTITDYKIMNHSVYSKIKNELASNYYDLPQYFESEKSKNNYPLSAYYGITHYSLLSYDIIASGLEEYIRKKSVG
jgi:hypothetical protein